VRGEQVVERLDELDFSHPALDGLDEAARRNAVSAALKGATETRAGYAQQRVLGSTDTVVRVSPGVYSLGSKQPGAAAAATTALPQRPPRASRIRAAPTPAVQPVRSLLSPHCTCAYLSYSALGADKPSSLPAVSPGCGGGQAPSPCARQRCARRSRSDCRHRRRRRRRRSVGQWPALHHVGAFRHARLPLSP
jgi:hypothetical protein